jgi:hypothetical protein
MLKDVKTIGKTRRRKISMIITIIDAFIFPGIVTTEKNGD